MLRPARIDRAVLELHSRLDAWRLGRDDETDESRVVFRAATKNSPDLTAAAHLYAAAHRLAHADAPDGGGGVDVWRPTCAMGCPGVVAPCTTHPLGRNVTAAKAEERVGRDDRDEDDDEEEHTAAAASGSESGGIVVGAIKRRHHHRGPSRDNNSPHGDLSVSRRVTTTVRPDGRVTIAVSRLRFEAADAAVAWPATLQIGLLARLRPEWAWVEWLGLGLGETYPDRAAAALRGRFGPTPATATLVPYLRPQETANRTQTRLVALSTDGSRAGAALRVASDRRFDFAALPVAPADLTTARHQHELFPSGAARDGGGAPCVYLNLRARLMGVGGVDSWTACVHDDFLVPPDACDAFTFHLDALGRTSPGATPHDTFSTKTSRISTVRTSPRAGL